MANITERRNKNGVLISFKIRVHRGIGTDGRQLRPFQTSFRVEPGWSEKTARKKAEAFAANYEKECREGLTPDGRQTFAEYSAHVLELKESRGKLKETTLSLYHSILDRLILPRIGHVQVRALTPQHLNDLYTALSADGLNRNGGKLSGKTILECHRLIRAILAQAVREGAAVTNAADRVEPPKREKRDPVYYELDDISRILTAAEEEPEQWAALIRFLIASGCRRGEALGLTWDHVDFEHGRIYIDKQVLYTKEKGVYIDTPKTEGSVRFITLPDSSMKDLRQHRVYQLELRFKAGLSYQSEEGGGYVFAQGDGKPLHPCSVTSFLTKFSKRHGLPPLSPHKLRHTSASLLIFGGMDPVSVSHRLGHSETSTTTDIYSHMIADADSRSAEIIGDIFDKKKA